ncbi:MAG: hypothetical protein Q4D89_04585 [Arachnia propionica]|uniref:hypothetical protein n=1 Tax=Arachnia propionica TaxID=1750 RepID=UPI00270D73A7|nr:hypothetical protein [Arachnia propionica]
MKSRRFVLTAAVGLALAPMLPASVAEARRRRRPKPTPKPQPTPTPTPSAASYPVDGGLRLHFVPAADAASYHRELNTWLRVFKLREQQYQAQVNALKYRQYYESAEPFQAAIDRHHAPRNIALLRYLLAVLAAEGNAEARSLDLVQVGVDAAVTRRAQPLIQAGLADARAKAGTYSDEREQRARQVRLTLFTDADRYVAEWLQASRAGTPQTDHAPYVPFFLGGDYESAVYAALRPDAEDKPVKYYWEGNGTDPVDVAKAIELSKQNKAYFDGLASLDDNPLAGTTYAA